MEQKRFKVYKYFHVKKSYEEMLAENDYIPKIKEFILDINAKMGAQWVIRELDTIFEAAYWMCGSLSHDFRKYDDYGTVLDSLPDHNRRYMAELPQYPEAMDTLHAIVYLMLNHDVSFRRPADTDEAFSRINKKRKRLAVALRKFSGKDKKMYHYDYSISINRNWEDGEVEEFINDYWEPDTAAEKILAFASYFDKGFDRQRMVDKGFSAVCNLYKKWDGQRYLGYEPQEYKDELRESLRSLVEIRYSSNKAVKQTRIRDVNPLFDDEELQQCRASQFVAFLKKHKRFSGKVNCEKDDFINRSFVAFWRKWEWKYEETPLPNGSACFRFLKDSCKLEVDVEMKGYGDFIRKRISDEKYDLNGVDLKVEDFLRNVPE